VLTGEYSFLKIIYLPALSYEIQSVYRLIELRNILLP